MFRISLGGEGGRERQAERHSDREGILGIRHSMSKEIRDNKVAFIKQVVERDII